MLRLMGLVVGIDPGLSGGLASVTGVGASARSMPLDAAGRIDGAEVARWLRARSPEVVVIEDVHAMPGQGVTSMFTFGMGFGVVLGVCAALDLRVERVTPQRWKAAIIPDTSIKPKRLTKADKAAMTKAQLAERKGAERAAGKARAVAFARATFPHVSLLATARSSTPHDGMADALCLAEYARRFVAAQRAAWLG